MLQQQAGGTWHVHIAPNMQGKGHAGTMVAFKSHLRYSVLKGMDELGVPCEEQTRNDQGRFMVLRAQQPGDITDYMIIYAPNSGQDNRTLTAQGRIGQQVKHMQQYWREVLGRDLHLIGDLNYSLQGEAKVRHHPEQDAATEISRVGGTQGLPSMRPLELANAERTYLADDPIDVESELAKRQSRGVRHTAQIDLKHQGKGMKHSKIIDCRLDYWLIPRGPDSRMDEVSFLECIPYRRTSTQDYNPLSEDYSHFPSSED